MAGAEISIASLPAIATLAGGDVVAVVDDDVGATKKATIQQVIDLAVGKLIQVVNFQTGEVDSTTVAIPYDDTLPQNTEGKEAFTLSITPTSATNKLKIEVVLFLNTDTAVAIGALFKDSDASALAAGGQMGYGNSMINVAFTHYMAAGTTSPITFKVRFGRETAAQCTVNGVAGLRKLGGVMASSITITEIAA